MVDSFIPWMDSIYIEGKYGWFVSAKYNALFRLDMEIKTCELIVMLPRENSNYFRQNPRCLKYGNRIYCFPDCGNAIWIYSLDEYKFTNIAVHNPHGERIGISQYIVIEKSLFLLSDGLKKIFEINLDHAAIAAEYDLTEKLNEISGSTVSDCCIYILCSNLHKICEFDLRTKTIKTFQFPQIKDTLNTICFDGNTFWMSGLRLKIYMWNEHEDTVSVLNQFPNAFNTVGIYGQNDESFTIEINGYDIPVFRDSRLIGNKMLFIPFLMDKIITCDIDTKKTHCIEIRNECESLDDIKQRDIWTKYLLEYVTNDRYVGIYSLKNHCILELDMEQSVIDYTIYSPIYMSENAINQLCTMDLRSLYEDNELHRIIYSELIRIKENMGQLQKNCDKGNIGKCIYSLSKVDL